MPRHYAYTLDHDKGFAPNVDYGICSLSGCNPTVEKGAEKGSWVIGIGGNRTHKPSKLIYAMKVERNLSDCEFRKRYPVKSKYLSPKEAACVLVSKKFYYFGNQAIDLPKHLQHLIYRGRNCKRVSNEDADKLELYLAERYNFGKLGNPNNPKSDCYHRKRFL